ncbi:MAG: hypothetical protein LBL92_05455 [Propionibacteriaceae bacterium]|jgi:hypothetical protein|nr:hypothetical protein [Propionibacteriaceae bacterium]
MRKALVGVTGLVLLATAALGPVNSAQADDAAASPSASPAVSPTPAPSAEELPADLLEALAAAADTPAATTDPAAPADQTPAAAATESAAPAPSQTPTGSAPVPSTSATAPTGHFCEDYPLVGQSLYDLTGYYTTSEADTETDTDSAETQAYFLEVQQAIEQAMRDMDVLLADQTIPSHLKDSLLWLQNYFSELSVALVDTMPDYPGQQFDWNKVIEMMTDETKAQVNYTIKLLTYNGYSYCGEEPPLPSPEPPTVGPTANQLTGSSTLDPSQITISQANGRFRFVASGFQPGEQVTATVNSLPTPIGQRLADSSGQVSFDWMPPASFKTGTYTLTLTGNKSGTVSRSFTTGLANTGNAPQTNQIAGAGLAALMLAAASALIALTASRRSLRRPV